MQKPISSILAFTIAFAIGTSIASAQTDGSTSDASLPSSETNMMETEKPGMKRPFPARPVPSVVPVRQGMLDKRASTTIQKMGQEKMMLHRSTTTGSTTINQRMQERREERMEKLSAQRKGIIERHTKMMFTRIEAAVDRLKKLSDRIGERIAKLKEKGVDTVKAESLLATAKTEIANAENALVAAKTAAQEALSSETPKEAFEIVRTHVEKARDAVKKAHKALVDSVVALKGKSGGVTATTTASTTAQ